MANINYLSNTMELQELPDGAVEMLICTMNKVEEMIQNLLEIFSFILQNKVTCLGWKQNKNMIKKLKGQQKRK